jgi:hypothetical protein
MKDHRQPKVDSHTLNIFIPNCESFGERYCKKDKRSFYKMIHQLNCLIGVSPGCEILNFGSDDRINFK